VECTVHAGPGGPRFLAGGDPSVQGLHDPVQKLQWKRTPRLSAVTPLVAQEVLLLQAAAAPDRISRHRGRRAEGAQGMLWTIAAVLVVLWLLGMVSAYTMGGFIHVLLVMALVVAVIQLIQGRKLL
jgi:hypothetical protein